MTEKEFQEIVLSWENMPLVISYIYEHTEAMDMLMKLAMDDSNDKNWRAMYLVDLLHDQYPELVKPHLQKLTDFLMITKNESKMRHVLKLISLNELQEENMAMLLNFCTDLFTNAALPVAVRVHAMQILYNIAQKEPDFSGELIEIIEHEIEYHGSAGISSRGRKLIAKLILQKSSL